MFFRLLARAPTMRQVLAVAGAALLRDGHAAAARRGRRRSASRGAPGCPRRCLRRPPRPPCSPAPGPRSTIQSAVRMVSSSCSTTRTVLPRSRRPFRVSQQAGVVARVQADGGLIQHVQHAHQARADLGGQADALGFAAGERAGRALQGQVIQADIHQEAQAGLDLLQDALGDGLLARGERGFRAAQAAGPVQGAAASASG